MKPVSVENGDAASPPYQAEAHPLLLRLLAMELKCDVSEIIDFELQVRSLSHTHKPNTVSPRHLLLRHLLLPAASGALLTFLLAGPL